MSIRTPLGQVEGLGAAHRGTEDFIRERVTAIALAPLSIWFGWSVFALIGADRATALAFFAQPANAVLMALFIIASMMHMALGLRVVIEDYIHTEGWKVVLLVLNRFLAWAVGAASIYALLKIALRQSLP